MIDNLLIQGTLSQAMTQATGHDLSLLLAYSLPRHHFFLRQNLLDPSTPLCVCDHLALNIHQPGPGPCPRSMPSCMPSLAPQSIIHTTAPETIENASQRWLSPGERGEPQRAHHCWNRDRVSQSLHPGPPATSFHSTLPFTLFFYHLTDMP